ncbi:MAG: 2-hydroxymuconate tautomerase family protein [Candidatus Nezhaarchaeales archaeon]|nr:2-hydroxymuconate tautomerase family protein [Candidatus Nezhaarchaeota archaeon]
MKVKAYLTAQTYKVGGRLMPIVHVYMWSGVSNEAKKKIITGITNVFVEMGIPKEAVEVVIQEVPKENWGVSGEQASEKLKHVKPP